MSCSTWEPCCTPTYPGYHWECAESWGAGFEHRSMAATMRYLDATLTKVRVTW
jgi:hypothetical protein